ncbi:hypothetical protein GGR54DRAFT_153071 [Hypoxylon sp. NC1633]|nr:hypothetical protein GGR54DRAFT_153071 [Hypoxylon sp. NC1633]
MKKPSDEVLLGLALAMFYALLVGVATLFWITGLLQLRQIKKLPLPKRLIFRYPYVIVVWILVWLAASVLLPFWAVVRLWKQWENPSRKVKDLEMVRQRCWPTHDTGYRRCYQRARNNDLGEDGLAPVLDETIPPPAYGEVDPPPPAYVR